MKIGLMYLALVSAGLLCVTSVRAEPVRKNSYGVWSKAIFADTSTVDDGSVRFIFVAGMAAEDPDDGHIQFKGDFAGQCRMAYRKIHDALKAQHASMNDIVRTTAYLTDMRDKDAYQKCQREAMGTAEMPPHTLLGVSSLAWPGMLVEVEVTAITPRKKSSVP
ncbi:RidA family protein [Acetobacter senegalensis]|uniref:RidA family protein n=1 Tax=Acetobacter senegalensis TaxID=446692 RepID=UPI00128E20AD|nr:RidA family protein [Acetobacter senegalensis]MCG4256735.1 RidA family protein [Acetobacter senegalensis]MCG4266704.1 RidA family protein [Acetobacter senegalensis]MPQ74724.1 RidA family protein [Acetobacter senegalensis]